MDSPSGDDVGPPEVASVEGGMGQPWGESDRAPVSPRATALADLYRHAATLATAGDLAAAQALHASIGALLGDVSNGDDDVVIDLASERAKRGAT